MKSVPLIEPAIRSIEQAPFLTPQQKRNIFYHNARPVIETERETEVSRLLDRTPS